jgi:uncharacterized protein (TIGR02302 family)
LRYLTWLARSALLIERLARVLAPAVIIVGFFVALSWTGLWLGANVYARMAGAGIFLALLLVALARLRRFSPPGDAEARAALDAQSPDAPAAALADALANAGDPRTQSLWRLHLRRAERNVGRLRPPLPAPRLWLQDKRALGALAVLALCAAGLLAGPERYARVAAAFDWRWRAADSASFRIDAWIDPPAYTGKPPIVLPLADPDAKAASISAPVGSIIVVRASDDADLRVTTLGGVETAPSEKSGGTTMERRFALRGDGGLRIARGGAQIAQFSLRSLPDAAPTITPLGPPQVNLRGSFVLAYRIDDDYGARDARVSATPAASGPPPEGHALFAPPEGPLDLPAAPGGLGEGRTTLDWTDSPYAGAPVTLTLSVRDHGGNEGKADVTDFLLPQKLLTNPLAKALAEQRRLLALDSAQKDRVLGSIDALMIAPELFTPKLSVYLGLRYAHDALRRARDDAALVAVCDFLWDMALHIEEGDATQAERDLRAAQKALREALNRGASPEEIARLTQQLQKALDAYLAEMEKNAAKSSRAGASETGDGRTVTPKDFKSMLDQLAEAAKDGDKNAAMALLDQMQDMLENLRKAEKSNGSGQAAQNRRNMRDLDKLMREQQKLRDDTFAHRRGEAAEPDAPPPQAQGEEGDPPPGENRQNQGMTPFGQGGGQTGKKSGVGSEGSDETAQQTPLDLRQQELRDRLESLQRRAGRPGGEKSKGLAEAGEAMGQAERALRQGNDSAALDAQGRALENLRKGAAEMAAQAQQVQPGEDESPGEGKNGGLRGQNGEGPFGHASRQNNVDATAAQKARKVLEELRRRLSDPNRAREELDYLERLIRPD